MPAKKQMLNLSAVARRLDIPYQNLRRLVQRGKLIPDAQAGAVNLFNEESVTRVEEVLAKLFPGRFSHRIRPSGLGPFDVNRSKNK